MAPPILALAMVSAAYCSQDAIQKTAGVERVCIDVATNRDVIDVWRRTSIIPANTEVEVTIVHHQDDSWIVTLGGSRGIVQPKSAARKETLDKAQDDDHRLQVYRFAPRKPGEADLTVTKVTPPNQPSRTRTIEFEVVAIYWGAIRFGLGTVFGDAAGRKYRTAFAPGSQQLEIQLENNRTYQFELVMGAGLFVFDLVSGGRSYPNHNLRIAPFIGFGLLSDTPSGIEALNSFHVGFEFELARSVSVAATAVLRSVEVLADDLAVGAAVEPQTQITERADRWGFGLVLNVSPGFLVFQSPFK